MSKGTKTGIFILIVLIIVCGGFGIYFAIANKTLTDEKQMLQEKLEQVRTSAKNAENKILELEQKISSVNNQIESLKQEKASYSSQVESLTAKQAELQTALNQKQQDLNSLEENEQTLNDELSRVTKNMEKYKKDREELAQQLKDLQSTKPSQSSAEGAPDYASSSSQQQPPTPPSQNNDEYWASILKSKAEAETELGRVKEDLRNTTVKMTDLQDKNAQLQVDLDSMTTVKTEVDGKLAKTQEVVDNLSVELARTKREYKETTMKSEELKNVNEELRKEVKRLVAAKTSLEQSVVKLSKEKQQIEGKLGQTEDVIQSKIDEIWEIKAGLDKTIKDVKMNPSQTDSVELPPIVVSSQDYDVATAGQDVTSAGFSGKVVSVNTDNNFLIVDIGENKGVRLGDMFNIFRNKKQIAQVEVIQVRKDISAADIKNQKEKIQPGDIVQ